MSELEKAARQALEALENPWKAGPDGVANAITALRQALEQPAQDGDCKHCTEGCPACDARKQPAQEPVAWVDLLKAADEVVRSKTLWKRFIDGTPLANDIPCWMADFALEYTRPQAREGYQAIESALTRLQKRYADLEAKCQAREPLTDEQIQTIAFEAVKDNWDWLDFARAIEAALGIKGQA